MTENILNKAKALSTLPKQWPEDLLPFIQARVKASGEKLVILDDDPTGTQTVHGLGVLTTWSIETLKRALQAPGPGFFILTNSRSLDRDHACALGKIIGMNLQAAAEQTGIRPLLISRSDSTLRGHFPHEVDALATVMGIAHLPYLLIPFFPEGGRLTIGDVHYVAEGEHLVPAAMTPYAKDAVFGYSQSDLKAWVAEMTAGRVSIDRVASVSLDHIRKGGPDAVRDILCAVTDFSACIVNAVSYRDLEVLVCGLLKAGERGRHFLLRTAAAFVRVRTGIKPRATFLSRSELVTNASNGGLFIVGSYVPKTTAQIADLIEQTDIIPIEINVTNLLDRTRRETEIGQAADRLNSHILQGRDVVVFTSRALVTGSDAKNSLGIGQTVSDSLIQLVKAVRHPPRYLVAKGGITSSDIATKGLQVRQAVVSGQVMPGVPVWRLGNESRYPGMSYIIFPGNVGEDTALSTIQQRLAKGA